MRTTSASGPSLRHKPLLGVAAASAALLIASTTQAQEPLSPPPRAQAAMGYAISPAAPSPGFALAPSNSALPPDTAAAAPAPAGSMGFDLGVVTEVPIMVGGQATLELPYGILVQGEVGVLPPAYVNAVDAVLRATGSYNDATSQMVRQSLTSSLIVRLSAGLRPFSEHGFEIMGGYTLSSLGGGLSARQAIEVGTGVTLPAQLPDAQIGLKSTIHSVHVSMGWRWVVADHLLIRASIAYLQGVSSSSRVGWPAAAQLIPGVASRLAQIDQVVDSTLNTTYTTYLKMPVLGLSVGYRF